MFRSNQRFAKTSGNFCVRRSLLSGTSNRDVYTTDEPITTFTIFIEQISHHWFSFERSIQTEIEQTN